MAKCQGFSNYLLMMVPLSVDIASTIARTTAHSHGLTNFVKEYWVRGLLISAWRYSLAADLSTRAAILAARRI